MGLEINNVEDFTPGLGNAQEIDLSQGAGEVITPGAAAEAAAQAAADNKIDDNPLNIKDETINQEEEEEEVIDDVDSLDKGSLSDDEPKGKEAEEEEEKTGYFTTIGKHFYDEGILDGYSEEMEDSPEAFQEMIEKTVEKRVEDYKAGFKNPVSQQFLEYIENGGDPSQFMQLVNGPDFTKITDEVLESNEAMQKQLMVDYYMAQGDTAEEAQETVQALEDAGQLYKRSKKVRDLNAKAQESKKEQELQRVKEEKIKRQENLNTYLNGLKKDIDSREDIGGFKITSKAKKDFYDYITKVDPKSGKTKLQQDSSDPEKELLMAFFYFNDFKAEKLGKTVKSKEVKSLQEKLGRYTDTSAKQKTKRTTPVDKSNQGANVGIIKKALNI